MAGEGFLNKEMIIPMSGRITKRDEIIGTNLGAAVATIGATACSIWMMTLMSKPVLVAFQPFIFTRPVARLAGLLA